MQDTEKAPPPKTGGLEFRSDLINMSLYGTGNIVRKSTGDCIIAEVFEMSN